VGAVTPFSQSFITQYSDAFDELLRLGAIAAQNKIEGKSTKAEDSKANRILTILQALSSPGLTNKNIEALEYCLKRLNESLAIPTVASLFPDALIPTETFDTGTFLVGTEDDSGGSSATAFALDGNLASSSTFLLFVFGGYLNTGGGAVTQDYWGTEDDISDYIPAR
jgi:hypothetical protein